jgi:ribonuclease HII
MKRAAMRDQFAFERDLWQQGLMRVAGVDEAGRGPLAGPVMAAAVCFPPRWLQEGLPKNLQGLNDSKRLTESRRESYFAALTEHPEVRFGIARVEAGRIDEINILRATHLAMNLALEQLQPAPQHVLVDGLAVDTLRFQQTAIVKGDSLSYSIAAASVLAKVTRDRLMLEYDRQYPAYGFAAHKGYGTAGHRAALAVHGQCPIHRRSFAWQKPEQRELFERPGN